MSETVKHTPTPWRAYRNSSFWEIQHESGWQIGDTCASSASEPEHGTSMALGEANARFIIEAVNSHAKLTAERDALREALVACEIAMTVQQQVESDLSQKDGWNLLLDMARAALAATPEAGEVGK